MLVAVLAVRIYYCFCVPIHTTDILRNLGYGDAFSHFGLQIYDLSAFDLSPLPCQFLWPNHYYTYPAVTMLLFSLISKIHASIFFGKIVFTLFDAVNAYLIYKISRDKVCALLFWANPLCIVYTSLEGQFESFVVMTMLLSLFLLIHKSVFSCGLFSLSIQTKLFPIFLFPTFYKHIRSMRPTNILISFFLFVLGWLPSLLFMFQSDYILHNFDFRYVPNTSPISWDLLDNGLYPYYPPWLVQSHWISGMIFILVCFYFMFRTKKIWEYLPALLFVYFAKASPLGQLWYFILLPAFCITVTNQKERRILYVLSWLFGISALFTICNYKIGYINPPDAYYLLQRCFWGI